MKKLIVITLILSLFLTSCGTVFMRDADGEAIPEKSTAVEQKTEAKTEATTEKVTEATTLIPTEEEAEEPEETPKESRVGFYDEVIAAGVYTRLDDVTSSWEAGVDIVCLDILLSGEGTLAGDSYKDLWQSVADAAGITDTKVYLALEYTLAGGEKVTLDVSDYKGAEAAVEAGYVEIYLYDDVHQVDGMWYSHLTADTTSESTVVSSVKITAGKKIDQVESITLTARVENSVDAEFKLIRK